MNTRFRIAMVGPLPPEHSGIAEYSAGLVELLRDRGVQVHTVVRGDVERMGMQQVIDELGQADAIVYQMGNHPAFHGWMLPLMAQVPGIVHLHDLVLHHMVAGVLSDEGSQRWIRAGAGAMALRRGCEERNACAAIRHSDLGT